MYVYGRTRAERYADEHGRLRTRRRDLPSDQREVLIPGHRDGFIDWDAYQDIQRRLDGNIPPAKGAPGTGAVREGSAHPEQVQVEVDVDAGLSHRSSHAAATNATATAMITTAITSKASD